MSQRPGHILVVTSVHPPDDPRIRQRTVGVLARHTAVRYATAEPGPSRVEGFDWTPLRGGRLRRGVSAARACFRRDVAVASVHDPELLPAALVCRWLRRIPVVFDLHENLPAQLRTKSWLPRPVRRPLAALAAWWLRLAERHLTVTLAEEGYGVLFRDRHPVFPNYPLDTALPDPGPGNGTVVYLGDVTEARGAVLAVRAVAGMSSPLPLVLVGRCNPALRRRLAALAAELGVDLELTGFLPHEAALRRAAAATVAVSPLRDLPNYRSSLPTKVVEYLAVGVPVVASDLPGTAAAVGGLPGVRLVPPGDVAAWSAALDTVAADPGVREQAQANTGAVRQRFRWPAEAVVELYLDLLAG